ncbi:hypothetical protein FRC12_001683 [Ceratobasidium sp. 428]|nr:hypothetical protein FRC12_001683 [Ceratobasidium sp. 428]
MPDPPAPENAGEAPVAPVVRRKPGRPRKAKPVAPNPPPAPGPVPAQEVAPVPPIAFDGHGNQFPPPVPEVVHPPPPPPAAPTNNSNYRDDEVRNLLRQISKFKPYTDEGWNKVVTAFNADTAFSPRTLKSLTEKFRKLKDMKKPTGNPQANVFHEKALECEREIHALTSTFGINDEHASDEDIEITGFRDASPAWNLPGLDDSSSSDVEVLNDADHPKVNPPPHLAPAAAYNAASSKASGKRKTEADQPQRAAPVARRESTKSATSRTSANQLQQGIARLVENTSPQIEQALNGQRHQDNIAQIQLISLLEEVRTLRSQLDTERERRAELSSKLQRYELLEDMHRLAAPGHGYTSALAPGHFPQPHPFTHVVPPFAPVAPIPAGPIVPNVPVAPAPIPEEHIDPQLFP